MIVQAGSATAEPTENRQIILTRTYDAPRELVWEAWTRAEHLAHWWGPDGFTTTTSAMEAKPGGAWRFMMHGPDGTDYPNVVEYVEVVEPELLVYVHGDGENAERDFHVTVRFTEVEGGTNVTSRMLFPTAEARQAVVDFGAIELGNQTYARLTEYLKSM